jgi:hypothetical protein
MPSPKPFDFKNVLDNTPSLVISEMKCAQIIAATKIQIPQ